MLMLSADAPPGRCAADLVEFRTRNVRDCFYGGDMIKYTVKALGPQTWTGTTGAREWRVSPWTVRCA
jgi:hypothetical protein